MDLTEREKQQVFMDLLEEMTEKALEKSVLHKDKPVKKDPISFFTNPYDFQSQTGMWKERRSSVSHQTLRTIAERNPIVSAIINTRIQQVATFSSPVRLLEASGNNALGYRIIHKDRAKDLTEGEKNYVLELENYIWHCGMTGQKNIYSRDNFDIWLRKIAAAVFQIDPAEINFYQSANSGGSAPMFEGNQEAKLKISRDKGLRPLLSAVSLTISGCSIPSTSLSKGWALT
jgi:hypothetical protein